MCGLDCGGGAVHGHLAAAAGDGFPCSPTISDKLAPLSVIFFNLNVTAAELVITSAELVMTASELEITAGELVITAAELVNTATELEVCFTHRGAPVWRL